MDRGQRSVFMVVPDPHHWCVFVCVYLCARTTGQERGKYAKILNKTLTLDFINSNFPNWVILILPFY